MDNQLQALVEKWRNTARRCHNTADLNDQQDGFSEDTDRLHAEGQTLRRCADELAALLAQREAVTVTPSAAAGIADLMGGDSGALRVKVTRHELTDLCLSGQAYTRDGKVNLLDETGGMARELMETWQQREAAPSRWQPIETAPKDGTEVCVWNGYRHLAAWVQFDGEPPAGSFCGVPYCNGWHDRGSGVFLDPQPTLWVPVPAPPPAPPESR